VSSTVAEKDQNFKIAQRFSAALKFVVSILREFDSTIFASLSMQIYLDVGAHDFAFGNKGDRSSPGNVMSFTNFA
jgi:hypothetical protein